MTWPNYCFGTTSLTGDAGSVIRWDDTTSEPPAWLAWSRPLCVNEAETTRRVSGNGSFPR
jgi:hypothetical protein